MPYTRLHRGHGDWLRLAAMVVLGMTSLFVPVGHAAAQDTRAEAISQQQAAQQRELRPPQANGVERSIGSPEDWTGRHDSGPAEGRWTVIGAKNDGVSPGFTIRDAAGQMWFLKFDPPGYRAMATETEVVVTKLFWALGYSVPEVYLTSLRPDRLTISDTAQITPPNGQARRFKRSDVEALLRKAHRDPDGSYRIVASRALGDRWRVPLLRHAFG